jgi:hypothetical protein
VSVGNRSAASPDGSDRGGGAIPRVHAAMLLPLPDGADSDQRVGRRTGATPLPWVLRLAQRLVDGERIALHERDRDEQLAILRAAVELVRERTKRRPCARRRRAA